MDADAEQTLSKLCDAEVSGEQDAVVHHVSGGGSGGVPITEGDGVTRHELRRAATRTVNRRTGCSSRTCGSLNRSYLSTGSAGTAVS